MHIFVLGTLCLEQLIIISDGAKQKRPINLITAALIPSVSGTNIDPYSWKQQATHLRIFKTIMRTLLSYVYLQKMIFVREPISDLLEYRVYPTASYLRHKIYKPLGLYCDYYNPIRELFWNSSYWPLYKSTASFAGECGGGKGPRLQRVSNSWTIVF